VDKREARSIVDYAGDYLAQDHFLALCAWLDGASFPEAAIVAGALPEDPGLADRGEALVRAGLRRLRDQYRRDTQTPA